MTQGNHARGSLISVMRQKKAKSRTGRSRAISLEAKFEKLRAKVSKERAETKRMKQGLIEERTKLEEEKSEQARMLEDKKLAIEENVTLYVYYMVLLAFLCGGNGGA